MSLPHKRHRQPLPSADEIAGNDDLMTEILIPLPAKSLCRFKCVSKRWYSLISHPHFSFLRMPHSTSGIFFSISSRSNTPLYKYVHLAGKRIRSPPPFKPLTFVDDPSAIDIEHSCNGLFLLSSSANYWANSNYYIYNPTTKQFANIPTPSYDSKPYVPAMNLAFDPSRALHYRIVFVRSTRFRGTWTHVIEIYSSETRAWRTSGDPFTSTNIFDFTNGVFFNGTMHWLNSLWKTCLRFDVDKECLETMPLPKTQDGKDVMSSICYFGESGSHLYAIRSYVRTTAYDVLEMESNYSNWVLKYRVDLDDIKATFPGCPSLVKYSVLHLVLGEEEKEPSLVLRIPGMILSYNLKDKSVKKLDNFVRCGVWPPAHQYIEILFRI